MSETADTAVLWEGNEALRPFLVAIAELEPFPQNPRRGDVAAIRGSLVRFGQVKPIVIDGLRIIAGHHLVKAAQEEGWTHIAAIPNAFGDDDEARAFLLADNRTSELGTYENEALVEHLKALAEIDGLFGTGYTTDDLDERLAALRRSVGTPPAAAPGSDTKREHRDPSMKELVLLYGEERFKEVENFLGIIAKEKGTQGTSETVYAALEHAARAMNT